MTIPNATSFLTAEEYWRRRPGKVECPPPRSSRVSCAIQLPNVIMEHRNRFEFLTPHECFLNTRNCSDINYIWWLDPDRPQELYPRSKKDLRPFPPDYGLPTALWQSGLGISTVPIRRDSDANWETEDAKVLQWWGPGLWWSRLYTSQRLALQRFIKSLFGEPVVSDGWVPEHPVIDRETRENPPRWWRKEFGHRWEWDPAAWAPRWELLPGHWVSFPETMVAVDPKGLLAHWASLPAQGFKIITDWAVPSTVVGERLRYLYDYMVPERFKKPAEFRPEIGSISYRPALQLHGKARYQRYMRVGVFAGAGSSSVVANSTRWMGDPRGDPRGAAAIAEYDAWKKKHWTWDDSLERYVEEWSNRRRIVRRNEDGLDFHDRMRRQAHLLPKKEERRAYDLTFCISEERDAQLAAKFRAHAADLKRKREEYDLWANEEEKKRTKLPLVFSTESLPSGPASVVDWNAEHIKVAKDETDKWKAMLTLEAARLASLFKYNSEIGNEHTGFENLANKELRSLKYRKGRAIPRYKDELVSDLEKPQDEDAPKLPDEDAIPDEDGVPEEVAPVAGAQGEEPEEVENEESEADDEVESEEPEADDEDADGGPESFSAPESETSEGSCYNNDPRFSDDEDAVGAPEGHDHLVPMYEDATTQETDPLDHDDLEGARRLVEAKAAAGEYCHPGDPEEATREKNGIKVNVQNEEFCNDAWMMTWLFENPTKEPR